MDDRLKWESLYSMTISEYCDGCLGLSNSVTVNLRKLFDVCVDVSVICKFRSYVSRNCASIVSIQTTDLFIPSSEWQPHPAYLPRWIFFIFNIWSSCVLIINSYWYVFSSYVRLVFNFMQLSIGSITLVMNFFLLHFSEQFWQEPILINFTDMLCKYRDICIGL